MTAIEVGKSGNLKQTSFDSRPNATLERRIRIAPLRDLIKYAQVPDSQTTE